MTNLSEQLQKDQAKFLSKQQRRLKQAAEFVRSELQKVIGEQGSVDHHASVGQPPLKQSGRLLESINVRVEGDAVVIYSDCPYAAFVERDHPYWSSTIQRIEPQVRAIVFGE